MDTRPEYIKMCKKAEEVQEIWKITQGDFVSHDMGIIRIIPKGIKTKGYLDGFYGGRKNIIWLPRQDQLQDLVKLESIRGLNTLEQHRKLMQFILSIYQSNEFLKYETWEQLWLAYVMKEKFNKTWNGEDWVDA